MLTSGIEVPIDHVSLGSHCGKMGQYSNDCTLLLSIKETQWKKALLVALIEVVDLWSLGSPFLFFRSRNVILSWLCYKNEAGEPVVEYN